MIIAAQSNTRRIVRGTPWGPDNGTPASVPPRERTTRYVYPRRAEVPKEDEGSLALSDSVIAVSMEEVAPVGRACTDSGIEERRRLSPVRSSSSMSVA